MVNFQESWYLSLEFQRDVTQFCGISMGGTWFCLEFSGVKGKIKNSTGGGGGGGGGHSEKYVLNTPYLALFSGIAH